MEVCVCACVYYGKACLYVCLAVCVYGSMYVCAHMCVCVCVCVCGITGITKNGHSPIHRVRFGGRLIGLLFALGTQTAQEKFDENDEK